MRYALTILMALGCAASALAGDMSLSLDRCQVVNNSEDRPTPSKIVLNFTIPQDLIDKEIVFAELSGSFALQTGIRDSSMEFRFCPLLSQLPEGPLDYSSLESVTDSMSAGSWIATIGGETSIRVPLTEFIREVAGGERQNYGLVGTADLLGDNNLRLPEVLGEQLRELIRIRIIYK